MQEGPGREQGASWGWGLCRGPRRGPCTVVLPCPSAPGPSQSMALPGSPGSPAVHSKHKVCQQNAPGSPRWAVPSRRGTVPGSYGPNPVPASLTSASHLLTYQNLTSQ